MPVESIANLIQNLSDQVFGQTQSNGVQKSLLGQASPVTAAVAEDSFTPSAQNGSAQVPVQDAGLFQFAPGTLTTIRTNSTGQAAVGAAITPGAAQAPAAPSTQEDTSAASAANLQLQIQSLNAALPALGLTKTEINQIDRIAALVQNFNPAAYANLVSQFEALAQNAGPSLSANATVLPSPSGANSAVNSANGNGYQVQGISITFTGSTQPGNSSFAGGGGKNSDANSTQSASAGLQIGQVQFTLINGHGQTVRVQAP
jgi:hypothetical protein